MEPVADDALLTKGLQTALARLEITPDDVATQILHHAALLSPDDGQHAISTTRLFVGAVEVGKDLSDGQCYPAGLARVLANDTALGATYQQKVLRLFETEPAEAALKGLEAQWFSRNVEIMLRNAASQSPEIPLSDRLVSTMLKSRNGRLYERMPIDRVAAEVEKLRRPSSESGTAPATLASELDAALSSLKIVALEQARLCLIRAAQLREPQAELHPRHILWAALEAGGGPSGQAHPTNPSAMLFEAIKKDASGPDLMELKPPPPQSVSELADPSNPLRLAEATKTLLHDAYAKQRDHFQQEKLGPRGLVVGLLIAPPEKLWTELSPATDPRRGDMIRARFREVVRERSPEQAQRWLEALGLETASIPKLDNDQPWSGAPRDHLGITNDAIAIANVAAAQATNLPLAFGIFGDWGAGKTFFMRLIYEQIARVVEARTGHDGFEHDIVQIQFNAWHYAETSLWASLVGHIFDELDRWMTRRQNGDKQNGDRKNAADELLKRLATSRQLTLEAASELVQRRKDHTKAASDLADAQKSLVKARQDAAHAPAVAWRAVLNTARDAIARDEDLKQELGTIRSTLGLSGLLEDKAKLAAALDELNRSASAGTAALGALRATFGNAKTVALALAVLVGIPLLVFALREGLATEWPGVREIGRGLEALGGLVSAAAVLIHSFAGRVKSLAEKLAGLRQQIDDEIRRATEAEAKDVEAAATNLAGLESEVEKARTVLQATADKLAAALQDYAEETGAVRIRRFVRARAGQDGYGKHLGLISTIRKDFEQLESLMLLDEKKEVPAHIEEAREHYQKRVEALIAAAGNDMLVEEQKQLRATAQSMRDVINLEAIRFRRIVLYIDDLDRCEPDKVVEVLQAVNMLLSFRLFVVVVAVDARWLSRSLEKKYPDFFGRLGKDKDELDLSRRATAADYLEKIFQVPYWVPRMIDKASIALVGDLVAADRTTTGPPPAAAPAGHGVPADGSAPEPGPEPAPSPISAAEDDQPETLMEPDRAPGLTSGEIQALMDLSDFLGGSPRRARRFVNIYRVAKASLAPKRRKELEAGEFRALAVQLAISTGAPKAFAAWVDACTDRSKPIDGQWVEIASDEEERDNLKRAFDAFRKMPDVGNDAQEMLAAQRRSPDVSASWFRASWSGQLPAATPKPAKRGPSTRNHSWVIRRFLNRRWWTFFLVHVNGEAASL
jgi:hypothetical protein